MMDRDGGIRYCTRYLVRYVLASVAVALFLAYIALSVSGTVGRGAGDAGSLTTTILGGALGSISVKWVLAAIPLAVLAFLVGANGKGTDRRLYARIVLNIYLAVLMVMVSSDPEYMFGTTIVNDSVSIDSMTIGMDALPITVLLLVIPVSSILDAVLEYRDRDNADKA